jgi:hypothetical protein
MSEIGDEKNNFLLHSFLKPYYKRKETYYIGKYYVEGVVVAWMTARQSQAKRIKVLNEKVIRL